MNYYEARLSGQMFIFFLLKYVIEMNILIQFWK